MEENKDNVLYCSHCGAIISEDEDYETVDGDIVCTDCYERHTTTCERCGETIWTDDSYGDEYTTLCRHCYENHYTRCSCCDALLHEDDAYHLDGYDYCSECYHDEVDRNRSIHDYGYKPEPIFYGDSKRYFGVELEIDGVGKDSDNADELLRIANSDGSSEHIYIKGDGSLDDGMELVTHPMRKPKLKELPTAEQVMNMVRGTDIELPCLLAMWLSLRMSEVRGLQFRDLNGNILTVCRSNIYFDGSNNVRDMNKTYKSTRKLTIPDYIKDLIEVVQHERDDDFIVQMEYQTLRSKFYKLLEERGYHMTFHDLRHLSASVMLMLNIPDKYAMERGGWSTNSTLKSVYQHTFSEERKQVDKKIDDYFNSLLEGSDKE